MRREKTSRPALSPPSRCSALGGASTFDSDVSDGGYGARKRSDDRDEERAARDTPSESRPSGVRSERVPRASVGIVMGRVMRVAPSG